MVLPLYLSLLHQHESNGQEKDPGLVPRNFREQEQAESVRLLSHFVRVLHQFVCGSSPNLYLWLIALIFHLRLHFLSTALICFFLPVVCHLQHAMYTLIVGMAKGCEYPTFSFLVGLL